VNIHSEFIISQTDGRPMYLQIMEHIKQRVAVGDWASGFELPSIRQLAMTLKVSVITVKRAYLELEHEGVIVTQHGRGSFVASTPDIVPKLYQEAFSHHLERTVHFAGLLFLSQTDLLERVKNASEPFTKEPV
jgi:GntR family transcriptional regulator